MLNNLHKFFQGKRKSLESFYLLYGILLYSCMLNKNSISSIAEAFKLLPLYLYEWIDMLHDFLFCWGGGGGGEEGGGFNFP